MKAFRLTDTALARTYWLLLDAVRREPWRVVMTLVLQAGGQLVQAGAVAAGVVAATATAAGQPVRLLGVEWGVIHTPLRVAGLAGAVLTMLASASAVSLWGKVLVARVTRRYEVHAARLAMQRYAVAYPDSKGSGVGSERDVVRLVTRDVRYASRAVLEALLGLPGLVTIGVAGSALVWLDPWATGGLVVLLGLAVPLYFWVNRRGAASLLGIERYARGDTLHKAACVARLTRAAPPREQALAEAERAVQQPDSRAYLAAYEQRLVAAHWSIFVGNLQFALVVSAAIAYVGLRVVSHEQSDGAVHALPGASLYLVGLVVVLGAMRSTAKHLTNLAIFEPSFGRWVRFVRRSRAGQTTGGAGESGLVDEFQIKVADPPEGSLAGVVLGRGAVVSVFAGESLTRLSVPRVLRAVTGGNPGEFRKAKASAAFARPDYPAGDHPLQAALMWGEPGELGVPMETQRRSDRFSRGARSSAGGRNGEQAFASPRSETPASVVERSAVPPAAELADADPLLRDLLASTGRSPGEVISWKHWNRLPTSTRFLFAVFAAMRDKPQWLLLEQKAYKKLQPEHRAAVLRRLREIDPMPRVLLIHSVVPDRLQAHMGSHFLLLWGGRVQFAGRREAFAEVRAAVLAAAAEPVNDPRGGVEAFFEEAAGAEDADVLLD